MRKPTKEGCLLKSQEALLLSPKNKTRCSSTQKLGQNDHPALYFIVLGQASNLL